MKRLRIEELFYGLIILTCTFGALGAVYAQSLLSPILNPIQQILNPPSPTPPTPEGIIGNTVNPIVAPLVSPPTPGSPPPSIESLLTVSGTLPIDTVTSILQNTPQILSTAIASIDVNNATIVAITNKPTRCQVAYGSTTSYGNWSTLDIDLALTHIHTLEDLAPGGTHHARVHCTDINGTAVLSEDVSFKALGVGVVSPLLPKISLLKPGLIADTRATIEWDTDKPAMVQLVYGTTLGYGESTPWDTKLDLDHAITIEGLLPNTKYHVKALVKEVGGSVVESGDMVFTTLSSALWNVVSNTPSLTIETFKGASTTLTVPPLLVKAAVFPAGKESVIVDVDCSRPSRSTVLYGLDDNLNKVSKKTRYLTHHVHYLTGIVPGALNKLSAVCEDLKGSTTTKPLVHLQIPPVLSTVKDALTVTPGKITTSTIALNVDTIADAKVWVNYGTNNNRGLITDIGATVGSDQLAVLTDLLPSTPYNIQVNALLPNNLLATAADITLFTAGIGGGGGSDPSLPTISNIHVVTTTDRSIRVGWTKPEITADLGYELRHHHEPITESNFGIATSSHGSSPLDAEEDVELNGTDHEFTIAGLTPDTTYHIAMRLVNENGGRSNVSNSISASTNSGGAGNPPTGGDPTNKNGSRSASIDLNSVSSESGRSINTDLIVFDGNSGGSYSEEGAVRVEGKKKNVVARMAQALFGGMCIASDADRSRFGGLMCVGQTGQVNTRVVAGVTLGISGIMLLVISFWIMAFKYRLF